MITLVLAAMMSLKDWPPQATQLVERYGPPQHFDSQRLEWKLPDRTLEFYREPATVVESVPAGQRAGERLDTENAAYDPMARELRAWGDNQEQAEQKLDEARRQLR